MAVLRKIRLDPRYRLEGTRLQKLMVGQAPPHNLSKLLPNLVT